MILGVYIITQLLGMAVKISSELLRSSVIFQPPYPITIIYVAACCIIKLCLGRFKCVDRNNFIIKLISFNIPLLIFYRI